MKCFKVIELTKTKGIGHLFRGSQHKVFHHESINRWIDFNRFGLIDKKNIGAQTKPMLFEIFKI